MPPFLGGLSGFLGYDLGRRLERLPALASGDQELPVMRLALHDWVIAWDRRDGRAWLGGRAVDGDRPARRAPGRGRGRRLAETPRAADVDGRSIRRPSSFTSGLDRRAYEAGVEAVRRAHRARRDLPGQPDPPARGAVRRRPVAALPAPADRRSGAVRGVPRPRPEPGSRVRPRAIVSASPEPFLSVDATGRVATDPIKGTPARGRDADDDRRLARRAARAAPRTVPRT